MVEMMSPVGASVVPCTTKRTCTYERIDSSHKFCSLLPAALHHPFVEDLKFPQELTGHRSRAIRRIVRVLVRRASPRGCFQAGHADDWLAVEDPDDVEPILK